MNGRFGWKADVATKPIMSDDDWMWRIAVILILASAVGSLVATVAFVGFAGGGSGLDLVSTILFFTVATMFFTCPGAIMLMGIQAILGERDLGRCQSDAVVVLLGAVTGAVFLATFSSTFAAGVGGLYGASTAVALICFQRLIAVAPKPLS